MRYTNAVLTSYATFKELYRSNQYRSPYQILSEFIRYIIITKSLRSFANVEIQGLLEDEFEFRTPLAVVTKSLMDISGLNYKNGKYHANLSKIEPNSSFKEHLQRIDEQNRILTNSLYEFIQNQYSDKNLDRNKICQDLIAFELDELTDNGYTPLISDFVLKNESNEAIKNALASIREGSILYSGLNCRIDENRNDHVPIVILLDTEILFHIAGLHGEVYKKLADDFLSLVDTSNANGKYITLCYFSESRKDIDGFYAAAEEVVEGNQIALDDTMRKVIEGCKDISDVVDKRTEFYRKLHIEHGIKQIDKTNFYTQEDNQFNLESSIPGFPISDELNFEGIRFCSHVNKLRKGYQTQNYLESKYIFVSDTRRVIEISSALSNLYRNTNTNEKYCEYAVSLNRMTNILWYLTNHGFGSTDYPTNLDVIVKARVILASYVSQKIAETYDEIKKKRDEGEISEEEAASKTLALKQKHTLPEEISAENIQSDLDFSEKYLNRYEEERAANQRTIIEKDKQIHNLEQEVSSLEKRLEASDKANCDTQREVEKLREWKEQVEKEENEKKDRKNRFKYLLKKKIKYGVFLFLRLITPVMIGALTYLVCKKLNVDYGTWVGVAFGVAGYIVGVKTGFASNWSSFITDDYDTNKKTDNNPKE